MCRALSVAFLVMLSLAAGAQKKFMAYNIKGTATYSIKNKQQKLTIGKIIPETAKITVTGGSQVIMICEQASAPIKLQEGSHDLRSFTNNCDPQDESVTANYLKYVWWQMTNIKGSAADEQKRNSTAAGVARGCPGIDFFAADTINYYSEDILLSWKVYSPDAHAEFALYLDAGSPIPLLVLPLKEESIHLDSLKKWMEPGIPYFWTVTLDGNQVCPRKLIQVWEAENFVSHMDSLNKLLITDLPEAERKYQMGYILEQQGFPGEAFRHYREAKAASPDNRRYKRTVSRFKKIYGDDD